MSSTLDRHDLYERCVQSPDDTVRVLRAIHGAEPTVLGEDFCGTAALSAAWIAAVPGGSAVAVDHDRAALGRIASDDRIRVVRGDAVAATTAAEHAADVIHAGNFSIGEWHTRADLLTYLRHVAARLNDGGVFVCDLYGGETAFLTGTTDLERDGPDGTTIRYTWEQRQADPISGRVVNAIHFAVMDGDRVEHVIRDAFVYRWRLWGLPELRDAMLEAGFASTAVYGRTPDAIDESGAAFVIPLGPDDLDDSFDVLIAARR